MASKHKLTAATLVGLCWVWGFLWSPLILWAQAGQQSPGAQLTLLESNQQTVRVALTVDGFAIEQLSLEGVPYQRIVIPNTEQTLIPGAPQVPSRGVLLGVPTAEGVALQVIRADYELLVGYQLYPAPQLLSATAEFNSLPGGALVEHVAPDRQRYTTDAFYPSTVAELGEVGFLRDQAVVQVQFYPVQYNPVRGELRLYREVVVQITWDEPVVQSASESVGQFSPAYEALLRTTLLNYAARQRPTATAAAVDSPMQQGEPHQLAPALKIGLNEEGIYRLTYTDLVNAGFDPGGIDPHRLNMTNQGADVPIYVEGEADGHFDSTDFILFYGTALRSPYTDQNVYWLTSGSEAAIRMEQRNSTPTGNAPSPHQFPRTHHAEEDSVYWQNMPGQGEERWFWQSRFSPNSQDLPAQRDYPVSLSKLSPTAETANIRVRLKGYTALSHRTRLYLNGQLIDDQSWQGQVRFDHQATIPHALLKEGQNLVRVEAVDTGASVDQILLDWIEIDAWHRYEADNDQLLFTAPAAGLQQWRISGFKQAELSVFDITDPAFPIQLINPTIERDGEHYQLTLEADAHPGSRYLALAPTRYKSPTSIVLDQPSAWKSPANGADYIIITHEAFYDSALRLTDHRRAAGLRVATIPVGDLYDEFGDGIFSPQAIRNFLRYAYEHWAAPAPTYVVLVGDAYQDYKDNLNTGTRNFVPSQTIESARFGELSSDHWFVQVSGADSLPDLFIGRLSAQTPQEAEAIIAKIILYDQQPPDATWNQRVLLVADDGEATFRTISEQAATRLPYYYDVSRIYATTYPPGNPRSDIISQINQGVLLVNYVGHGEYFGWGRWHGETEPIFQRSDIEALHNTNKLPVIIAGNCLNGFFTGPQHSPALAESLQRQPNAGAIAVWAPAGYGYATGHQLLIDEFYRAIFVEDQQTLGAAATAAKLATYAHSSFWRELVETYILFGDPATRLGMPPNFPYVKYTAPANGASEVALDQTIHVVFNKPMDPQAVTLVSNDTALSSAPSWNADFTEVTYRHAGFVHKQRYELRLSGQDRYGNRLGPGIVPVPWSLAATTDITAPTVTVMAPGNPPSSILTTSAIQLSFTEPVRPQSVTISITPFVWGSLAWDTGSQYAVFTHHPFAVGQRYTLTVLTATDRAGNSLPEPVQFSFTAGETRFTYLPFLFAGD